MWLPFHFGALSFCLLALGVSGVKSMSDAESLFMEEAPMSDRRTFKQKPIKYVPLLKKHKKFGLLPQLFGKTEYTGIPVVSDAPRPIYKVHRYQGIELKPVSSPEVSIPVENHSYITPNSDSVTFDSDHHLSSSSFSFQSPSYSYAPDHFYTSGPVFHQIAPVSQVYPVIKQVSYLPPPQPTSSVFTSVSSPLPPSPPSYAPYASPVISIKPPFVQPLQPSLASWQPTVPIKLPTAQVPFPPSISPISVPKPLVPQPPPQAVTTFTQFPEVPSTPAPTIPPQSPTFQTLPILPAKIPVPQLPVFPQVPLPLPTIPSFPLPNITPTSVTSFAAPSALEFSFPQNGVTVSTAEPEKVEIHQEPLVEHDNNKDIVHVITPSKPDSGIFHKIKGWKVQKANAALSHLHKLKSHKQPLKVPTEVPVAVASPIEPPLQTFAAPIRPFSFHPESKPPQGYLPPSPPHFLPIKYENFPPNTIGTTPLYNSYGVLLPHDAYAPPLHASYDRVSSAASEEKSSVLPAPSSFTEKTPDQQNLKEDLEHQIVQTSQIIPEYQSQNFQKISQQGVVPEQRPIYVPEDSKTNKEVVDSTINHQETNDKTRSPNHDLNPSTEQPEQL